jgi:hypothetical protein
MLYLFVVYSYVESHSNDEQITGKMTDETNIIQYLGTYVQTKFLKISKFSRKTVHTIHKSP